MDYTLDSEDGPWCHLPCVLSGPPVLYSAGGSHLCTNRQHSLEMCPGRERVNIIILHLPMYQASSEHLVCYRLYAGIMAMVCSGATVQHLESKVTMVLDSRHIS